jgi:repressor LexA
MKRETIYVGYRDKIYYFYGKKKRMPSYSEIADIFGFKSKDSAFRIIERLIKLGYIQKDSTGKLLPVAVKTPYSINLNLSKKSNHLGLPLQPLKYLGLVEAGFPTPAEESLLDSISIDDWIIREPESSFILKVKGDSMKDAGIHDGDMVIVERTNSAKIGDIVIAEVDGAWTMKYLRKNKNKFYLEPANRAYKNIIPKEGLKVQAVVRAVVRKYD